MTKIRYKKRYKKMTKKDFEQIKTLTDMGLSLKQIRQVTTRSPGTIRRIRKTANLKEYVALYHQEMDKYFKKEPKTAVEQQVNRDPSLMPTPEYLTTDGILRSILSELKTLNEKLANRKIIW